MFPHYAEGPDGNRMTSRISKYLDIDSPIRLFHTFILSNFNYSSQTWHFCSKENQLKIEKVQKRALRSVYNDWTSTYEALLMKAKVPSMYLRRIKTIAKESYKIASETGPPFLRDLLSIKDMPHSVRDNSRAIKPKVRTQKYGVNSFRFEAANIWNMLPMSCKMSPDISHFVSNVDKWTGPVCRCGYCMLCMIKRL